MVLDPPDPQHINRDTEQYFLQSIVNLQGMCGDTLVLLMLLEDAISIGKYSKKIKVKVFLKGGKESYTKNKYQNNMFSCFICFLA